MDDFRERKAERAAHYEANVRGWGMVQCTACSGSGRYRAGACGSCSGTGKERHRAETFPKTNT